MTHNKRLKELLSEHGVGEAEIDAAAVWEAFKSFGREVFDRDGVGLLFQVGTFKFSGKPLFYFDPVIQFEIRNDDGEFAHFEQTHFELSAPESSELKNVKSSLWSFEFATAEAFFKAVEALPEFTLAVGHSPYKLAAFHERV